MNRFIAMGSVLMFAFLVSIFSGAVYATQASTDTEVDLNVATVINISTPDTTTINCVSLNTLCTANTSVTVGTNNITGYTLQLNATSGYSNSLTNAATSETIPTLAQAYAAGSFPTNYWGYTGGLDKSGETGGYNCASNYCPVLAYQSTESNYAPNHAIKVTNAPANASATTINFGAKADITKPSGTYTTSVTFTAVTNYVPEPDPCLNAVTLYDNVACQSKGTQTVADLQAAITIPTSADHTQDTSNSGVYEYDSSVFGISSDADNTSTIYYYRGVLENDPGTYGAGSAITYPNYVKLGTDNRATCWRIVRTTGSGGVKMIYNGLYKDAPSNSCANAQSNAQFSAQEPFGHQGNSNESTYWHRNINRIGYTFNNDSSIQDSTTSTSVDTVFGSDSNPAINNARSYVKADIENWYANNMTNYTSKLEVSAGYCNDRTAYSDSTTSTSLASIKPYTTSGATMYFGIYGRNLNAINANKTPSLTCPRSTVDLYRYVANSQGLSNELKYPVALLTADEASFAGSGRKSFSFHANSYLRSGYSFWLLSPHGRTSTGLAYESILNADGYLYDHSVKNSLGIRPAISLAPGTIATSGTGTATDPWIVNP